MSPRKQPNEVNPFLKAITGGDLLSPKAEETDKNHSAQRTDKSHSIERMYNTYDAQNMSSEYNTDNMHSAQEKHNVSDAHSALETDNVREKPRAAVSRAAQRASARAKEAAGPQERFNMRIDGALLEDIKTLAKARDTDATKLIIEVMSREVETNRELIASFRRLVRRSR